MKNEFLTQIGNQQQMQVFDKTPSADAGSDGDTQVGGQNKSDLEKLYKQLEEILGDEGQKNYVIKGTNNYNERAFRSYVEEYAEKEGAHKWIKDTVDNAEISDLYGAFNTKYKETAEKLNAIIEAEQKAANKELYDSVEKGKSQVAKILAEGKTLTEESAVSYSKGLITQSLVDDKTPEITTDDEFVKMQEEARKVGATLTKVIDDAKTNEGHIDISVGDTTSKVKGIKFGGK